MQTPQNNLLNGRTLPRLIKWLKHVLIVIVILILMILSLGLLGNWIAITLVCFFATAMICYIRGSMKDAEKSSQKEIQD